MARKASLIRLTEEQKGGGFNLSSRGGNARRKAAGAPADDRDQVRVVLFNEARDIGGSTARGSRTQCNA